MIGEELIGQPVVIRARGAGVFFGTLADREGNEVLITDAHHIHQWQGTALTCLDIAETGINIKESLISTKCEKVIILDVIEVIKINPKCNVYNFKK